jgi:hypothetical protein
MANLLPRGLRRKSLRCLTIQSDDSPSLHGHVRCWDAFVRSRDGQGRGVTRELWNSPETWKSSRSALDSFSRLFRSLSGATPPPKSWRPPGLSSPARRKKATSLPSAMIFFTSAASRLVKLCQGRHVLVGVVIRFKEPQQSPPEEGAAARARLGIPGGRSGSPESGSHRVLQRSGERG